MRILLDECVDRRLAGDLTGHDVSTVPQMGWATISNGELLSLAEGQFDVFVTVDRNLCFQQNLPQFGVAVVVLHGATNRLADLRPLVPRLLEITRWYEETNNSGPLFEPMVTLRDSAIAIAGDESLVLAWRSEALASLILGQYRPYRIWGGVEPEVREAVAEFVNDPDPGLAARANFIVESMDRFDELGILGRWRFVWAAFPRPNPQTALIGALWILQSQKSARPQIYSLPFLFLAQDAFNFFDRAFLAAADILRLRLRLAVGFFSPIRLAAR